MFNFAGITHILPTPTGRFTSCGSVPASMLNWREPTAADIMAGRVHNGKAHYSMTFDTAAEWLAHAKAHGVNICESDTCACRNHIPARGDLNGAL